MARLALFIKTKTQPGKRQEVRTLWEEHLKARAEANEAQQVVAFCEDDQDPDTFYLFEIYRDREAFQQNAAQPWFGEYMTKVGPLLAGQPEVGMATPAWSKGLAGS
ncbi:MAG: antibiotic biosynthesis monooxygenase [Myxococcota bacterium]